MEAIMEPLQSLDWEDIEAVERAATAALSTIVADRGAIGTALLGLPNRPELLRLCEHYDILDKLVLYADDFGIRLRLHIFLPGYFDRPHNHRWSYASHILKGEYRHVMFGDPDLDESIATSSLRALHVRREHVGSSYALHHRMVHAVVAEPYTVSLVVRGPAVKDRFLVMDRKTGESWWQYGALSESTEEADRKRMTPGHLIKLTDQLRGWGLF